MISLSVCLSVCVCTFVSNATNVLIKNKKKQKFVFFFLKKFNLMASVYEKNKKKRKT